MFRYIGNKTRLLPVLMRTFSEAVPAGATVADIMAGTGSVSAALRKSGYHVIASDMMTYSKHHLVTQLLLDGPPPFAGLGDHLLEGARKDFGYASVLEHLNGLPEKEGYFFREFSPEGTPENGAPARKYFTAANARKIDAIRDEINDWIENRWITDVEQSVLKHTLMMAVNDVANISGTYGYFLSSFHKTALESLLLRPIDFIREGSTDHVVLQGFAEDVAAGITADMCYIDPPYMKRQYAANYHILETIARGDYPEAIGKSGLRDWWDQHSKFCTKTRICASFEKVIGDMDCPLFFISYSEDGLLSLDELVALFSRFGAVSYQSIEYARFRSNQSPLAKDLCEYLIRLDKK